MNIIMAFLKRVHLTIWLVLLSVGIFLLDLTIPLGVAAGVPYVTVILASLASKNQNQTIIWATICTVLTLVGYYMSPVGSDVWKVVFNRVLAIYAIWAVAIVSLVLQERIMRIKQLELDLHQSNYRSTLGMVAEYAKDAIVITDKQGLVQWVNKGFEDLSGYTLAEVEGKKPGDMLQGKLTSISEIKRLSDAIKSCQPIQSEIVNYHKNGTPYWIDIAISPVREEGQSDRFIAVERDITERKELELKLAEDKHSALQGSEQRSHLLSLMSQELTQPIANLLTLADNMNGVSDADECKVMSHQLRLASESLSITTKAISDLSIIAQGEALETIETFDANESISTTTNRLATLVEANDLPFTIGKMPRSEGVKLKGDKACIERALVYMALFALSHKQAREITFAIDTKVVDERLACSFELTFSDAGATAQLIGRIRATKESSIQAMDVALATGYEIIIESLKAAEGKVSIFDDGENSRIELVQTYDIIAAGLPKDDGVKKVLIAEDNKVNVIVLTKLLKSLGYESLDVAVDGQQAVEMATKKRYDLIMMDNHMPNMTGLDATKVIKDKGINSVIIACTADTGSEARSAFFENGASDVIYKPIKKNTLETAITNALNDEQEITA
ncbi:response regulator [Vibrio astriarenae]|uniref:response regulator n=1 Tax=Vibrio astriarenae TaxID=1481923 RepID=UPI0037367D31